MAGHHRRLPAAAQWSNPSLKDHVSLFTHGAVGQWTIPRKSGRDYVEQMTAEVREEREDSRGRIKVLWVKKQRDHHYLMDGALWLHPPILAALELADETSFDKASRGPWTIRTYRGNPIYTSEALVRAGTTNRFVYDTYLLAMGIIAKGEHSCRKGP